MTDYLARRRRESERQAEFEEYIDDVNAILVRRVGCDADALRVDMFAELFADGYTPTLAARSIFRVAAEQQAKRSPLTIHPPEDDDDHWTVSGDLREVVDCDEESTNYVVQDMLVAENRVGPGVTLDPEYSCFFAYIATEAQAHRLHRDATRLANGLVK